MVKALTHVSQWGVTTTAGVGNNLFSGFIPDFNRLAGITGKNVVTFNPQRRYLTAWCALTVRF